MTDTAKKPAPTTHVAMRSFERGFSSRSSGCQRQCACGRMFYNPDNGWTWEEGEIEKLAASGATSLEWSVETLILSGREFVIDCDCWRAEAVHVIKFLIQHDEQIAEFLTLEKRRKTIEAERSPVVREA